MADDTDDPKTTDPAAASGSDDTPPATPAGEGGDTSGGSSGGSNNAPVSTALNPQIVQAVGTTNHAVLNGAFPGGNGIAYQKVAQAAAYAVQDSTDYMRNIMSMASAATGVALQKMLAEKTTTPYADIITAATKAVGDAQETFTKVGTAASTVVKDFDTLA
ncbi:hypothetical protein [Thalassospira sp.]|uniref:hypothetical protein n=1 Tax=Thalassospira sp. TaxID=1912094 RepID=UPI0027339A6D|nr:hypothetical protein [Thalassospira sp.]MDP2696889.1 hypothetical protein [Thalassospira sp.]